MVQGVWSEDPASQLKATTQFRKLLSMGNNDIRSCPSVCGVSWKAGSASTCQAALALTNVVSGTSEHTQVVIGHGAVPMFVQLLSSDSDDVKRASNVGGDSPSCTDLVLGHGALMPLLAQLNENTKLSMLRNATRTLSNFCRGKPPTPFEQVVIEANILLPLVHLLQHAEFDIKEEVAWAISNATSGGSHK
ncbi:hypothetical protein PTKIN_Ptkin06aG0203700 [Pterospermum kingtungense]